jgi:hypothetical protein
MLKKIDALYHVELLGWLQSDFTLPANQLIDVCLNLAEVTLFKENIGVMMCTYVFDLRATSHPLPTSSF